MPFDGFLLAFCDSFCDGAVVSMISIFLPEGMDD
jgi:hypothetical protein